MIIDSRLELADDQALTATAVSTNVINFGSARDVSKGEPIWLVVVSKEAPTGTSPTIVVSVESDDNSGFSSAKTVQATGTITGAAFPLGTRLVIPLSEGLEQYLRARFTLGGTSPTFKVDAFLTNQEPVNWVAPADALPAP